MKKSNEELNNKLDASEKRYYTATNQINQLQLKLNRLNNDNSQISENIVSPPLKKPKLIDTSVDKTSKIVSTILDPNSCMYLLLETINII